MISLTENSKEVGEGEAKKCHFYILHDLLQNSSRLSHQELQCLYDKKNNVNNKKYHFVTTNKKK